MQVVGLLYSTVFYRVWPCRWWDCSIVLFSTGVDHAGGGIAVLFSTRFDHAGDEIAL